MLIILDRGLVDIYYRTDVKLVFIILDRGQVDVHYRTDVKLMFISGYLGPRIIHLPAIRQYSSGMFLLYNGTVFTDIRYRLFLFFYLVFSIS